MKNLYTPSRSEAQRGGRPVGVTLLTLLCFAGVIVLAVYGAQAAQVLINPPTPQDAATARTLLPLTIVLVPLLAVIGVGLWRMRQWARYLAVGFLAIGVVWFFIDGLLRYPVNTGLALGLTRSSPAIGMMLYLLHPVIGAVFRARAGD